MKYLLGLIIVLSALSCVQKIEFTPTDWELIADNQRFPEGPAWDNKNQILYNSNCYGDWISRWNGSIADSFIVSDGAFSATNGLEYIDGILYACDYKAGHIMKITAEGTVTVLIDGYDGKSFNRPNDILADIHGNLWFTDPKSYGKELRDGRLFKYNLLSDKLELVLDSLCYPNGLSFSPDHQYLYIGESALESVFRWKLDSNDIPYDKELFINLPGGDPDGMEFGPDGNLYIAHFGGGNVYAVSPEKKIIHQIPAPGKKPSNIEWGGTDRHTLFLTETETNAVYQMK